MSEVKRVVCEFCHAKCRLLLHSENGRLTGLAEDTSTRISGTTFPPVKACNRLRGAKEWMYHPDRVNFPLKRIGEKGEGKWQTISWEQAFDEIADRLKEIKEKHGAEAIGATTGTGRTMEDMTGRFFYLLGSPNTIGETQICYSPHMVVGITMLGWSTRMYAAHARAGRTLESGAVVPKTKCFLLIGMNPAQCAPRLWKPLRDNKKLGGRLIVIDPRRTESAEMADIWLQLRPGTDTALLMSMINVIIEEKLYDKEFIEQWCHGFDELVKRAQEYSPEKAAEITWVPAGKIREAARMYALNKPASAIMGMGIEHSHKAIEATQAKFILGAITANIDALGGDYVPGPSRLRPLSEIELSEMLSPEQRKKTLGGDRFRLFSWEAFDYVQSYVEKMWGRKCGMARAWVSAHAPTLYRAIITGEPYPVKAMITVASNPMVTPANTKLVYRALKSLELYVVMDYWMTPSAEIADYVLPVASWMERPTLMDNFGIEASTFGGEKGLPSTIPGEYDHMTDYEIFRGLGLRLGQENYWPWKNLEETFDYKLEPLGISFDEFIAQGGFDAPRPEYKKYEKRGFATPTGKIELYSTVFEKFGYDPLPSYEESFENPVSTPEIAKEYPLMLITGGRFHPMFHSEQRNIDSVRRRHPNPVIQINPQTAEELDLHTGEWIWIETLRGRIRMKCQLFSGINPGVVHCEHGWWFPELPGEEPWLHGVWESNVNVLTEDNPDICNQLSGGWPLKTALCKIYKVKEYK